MALQCHGAMLAWMGYSDSHTCFYFALRCQSCDGPSRLGLSFRIDGVLAHVYYFGLGCQYLNLLCPYDFFGSRSFLDLFYLYQFQLNLKHGIYFVMCPIVDMLTMDWSLC